MNEFIYSMGLLLLCAHPVAEHDGYSGESLYGDPIPVHVADPGIGVPAVLVYFPEQQK